MPLEPTEPAAAPTPGGPNPNAFEEAMLSGLGHTNPPAPVVDEVPEPAPEPTPAPEPVPEPAPEPKPKSKKKEPTGDEIDDLDLEEEDPKSKLPIDDLELEDEEPEEETKGKKAKPPEQMIRERRIEELTKEIKNVYKPKLEEAEETLKQRDARIQELEGFKEELETLRKVKEDYESEMSVVRLEKTDAFKKSVSEPLDAIEKKARVIAETYGIDEDKLWGAFAASEEVERRKILKDATAGLDIDPDDAFELRKLVSEAQPIFKERDKLFENATTALAELEARKEKETVQEAASRAKARVETTEAVASRIKAKLPFFNDVLGEVSDSVKDLDLQTVTPEKQAYYALAGASFPKIAKMYNDIVKERDSLIDDLASYSKASPRVSGNVQSPTTEKKTDFAAAMAEALHA